MHKGQWGQMATPQRVGLIGCGYWGRNHAAALARLGVLAAVSDSRPGLAEEVAAQHSARALDLAALLAAPELGAVVIAAAATDHAALTRQALMAGKHVFVEKPMALDPAEAGALCDLAEGRGLTLATGHIMRFHPAFMALHARVTAGELGPLRRIEGLRMGYGKFYPQVSVILDLLPHDLAMLLALVGDRAPVASHGFLTRVLTEDADIAEIELDFGAGLTAGLHVSRVYHGKQRRFTVIGTDGSLVFDDTAPWEEKLMLTRAEAPPQPVALDQSPPLDTELQHFLDCIAGTAQPLASGRHGLAVLDLLHAVPMTEVPMHPEQDPPEAAGGQS